MNLPNDLIMKEMSRIAIEQVTRDLAGKARALGENLPRNVSAKEALNAFADAIDKNNERLYGKGHGK